MNEFEFIDYLKRKIPVTGNLQVGIGDDAAVLRVGKDKKLVIASDVIVENVDFRLRELAPEMIGRKALAVNLSDMAAMGAEPKAFLIAIGKPHSITIAWLRRFYDGLLKLSRQFKIICAGGDFSASREFFASVTVLGEAASKDIAMRSGAKEGDWIGVTGRLGGSILGHHYRFMPRVHEGLYLARKFNPSSMIDISDGLCQDLGHVLRSSGVGAVIDLDEIPVSRGADKLAGGDPRRALQHALCDGEDFELLFTVPRSRGALLSNSWRKRFPRVPLTWIGKLEGKDPIIRWTANGETVSMPKWAGKGFSHF